MANLLPRIRRGDDLVDYYTEVYKGKIKGVEQEWLNKQQKKYEGCMGYMQEYAKASKRYFNSYAPGKGLDSKRTYVLWKLNSICTCLRTYGYGCSWKDCNRCPVHINCRKQLEEIDMGLDKPTGGKHIQVPEDKGDRLIFHHKGKKIEVYISDENKED